MAAVLGLTSASGFLALLDEPEVTLQEFALRKLDDTVDVFWPEIADELDKMHALPRPFPYKSPVFLLLIFIRESLAETEAFPSRHLAALLASKVHYHLAQYPLAMKFALSAEKLFDLNASTEFVHTLVGALLLPSFIPFVSFLLTLFGLFLLVLTMW